MAGRKLTKKQRQQIIDRQHKKLISMRAKDCLKAESDKERYTALIVANYGVELDARILPNINKPILCKQRSNLDALVAGDRVLLEKNNQQDFVVVARQKPDTLLVRSGFQGVVKPMAANVTRAFIVIAPIPKPNFYLLDKYLVAMKSYDIDPVIVSNKMDLCVDPEKNSNFLERLKTYQDIGYEIIESSCKKNVGLEDLLLAMQGNTSIFIGDSGVGKSSLINLIMPEENSKTGELSGQNTGTHTTSASKMFFIDSMTRIIDSPGIREFGLTHLKLDDVLFGFVEFQPYIGLCKYRNCKHDSNSPHCALQDATNKGFIAKDRMQSYLSIIDSLKK